MKKIYKAVLMAVFLLPFLTISVNAHESVHWLQHIQGDKMLVVFYDLHAWRANLAQRFVVRYQELSNGKSLPYDKAEIRVKQNGKEIRTFDLRPDENFDSEISYGFPADGKYDLEVKVIRDGKALVSASFPVVVGEGVVIEDTSPPGIIYVLVGVGITLGFLELRKRWIKNPVAPKKSPKPTKKN